MRKSPSFCDFELLERHHSFVGGFLVESFVVVVVGRKRIMFLERFKFCFYVQAIGLLS